jgi:hypothetical protein
MKKIFALAFTALCLSSSVLAEDVKEVLDRVNTLYKEGNYSKALEELEWARKEIEKSNSKSLATLLPDELAGLKGDKAKTSSALGITNIERSYSDSKKQRVKVTLTQTGGAGGAMGGLAGLGQMAAMFGAQSGQDVFRIDGMTASMEGEGEGAKLQVFLSSGSILAFDLLEGANSAILKEMANKIGVAKIDKKIKG